MKKITNEELSFDPFTIEVYNKDINIEDCSPDVALELSWDNQTNRFIGDYISPAIPNNLTPAISELKKISKLVENAYPILLAPYLNESVLNQLAEEKISGLDFSGNGVIVIPGDWFVMKTGNENQYPTNRGIKNVYRGKSSLVPRVFIEQPTFGSVSAIKEKIEELGGEISLSTVSKVLQSLEDDFLIDRNNKIRLIEPNKLLSKLEKNYRLPDTDETRFITVNDNLNPDPLSEMKRNAKNEQLKLAGLTPDRFNLLTNLDDVGPIYTSSIDQLLNGIEFEETQRFPDFELRQTTDPKVYFASGPLGDSIPGAKEFSWCSRVECYLQYNQGDKREREAAQKMRSELLRTIKDQFS